MTLEQDDLEAAFTPDGEADPVELEREESRGAAQPGLPSKRSRPVGLYLAGLWLVVLLTLVILAPYLPFVQDPDALGADAQEGPSLAHWMGTDQVGRDLFARVAHGGRVSLLIGIGSLIFGFFVGGLLGLTAGYLRGYYERVVMGAMDIMLSFPSLILALALLAALSEPGKQEGSIGKVVLVLTILAIPSLARITRANTLAYSQREFVTAAQALGAKSHRILFKEVLPNVVPAMLAFSFVALAILVVAEGALAFLGLSVEAPAATWGKLIQAGSEKIDESPHMAAFPCGVMFLTLMSLNYIGGILSQRFDVRESAL